MKLLGISGTNGAGKDSVGEYLAGKGWLNVSVSELLRDEARRRNLPIERDVLRTIGADWRRQYGLGVLVDKAVEKFKTAPGNYEGLVVQALRNPGEADEIHRLGGKIIWVDADPEIRYKRVFSRRRSEEDNKTYEEFLTEEKAEMKHSSDEATLSTEGVKAKADIFIENNGDDVNQFFKDLENIHGL